MSSNANDNCFLLWKNLIQNLVSIFLNCFSSFLEMSKNVRCEAMILLLKESACSECWQLHQCDRNSQCATSFKLFLMLIRGLCKECCFVFYKSLNSIIQFSGKNAWYGTFSRAFWQTILFSGIQGGNMALRYTNSCEFLFVQKCLIFD